MIKAIFFDIDGTLVSFETHRIPPSARNAIKGLQQKGIKIFVATGRHTSAINNLEDIRFDGYISINGGYCTVENNKCIYKNHIPKSDIEALVDFQKKNPFPCLIMEEEEMFINYHNRDVDHMLKMLDFPKIKVRALRESLHSDVLQVVSFFTEDREKDIMAILPGCESTRWYPLFTDIIPQGSHKGVGMDKILAYYNILPEETMAFGDGGNDISIVREAGTGVAMGNAGDNLKQVADYITTHVDEDGVKNALLHFGVI